MRMQQFRRISIPLSDLKTGSTGKTRPEISLRKSRFAHFDASPISIYHVIHALGDVSA
jgi:hypothetical protein